MDSAMLKVTRFDATNYLKTDEDIQTYLDEALSEDDPAAFLQALNTVARARGMTQLARETGLSRESLYQSLSTQGNPEFRTLWKVLTALGCGISVRKKVTA